MGAFGDGDQHLLLAVDECGGVVAGDLKSVAMGDGVGGAGFDAKSAKDAAVVIDVINLGVALAAADSKRIGVFGGFDVDAIGRAGGCAQETGDALFQAVLVAL